MKINIKETSIIFIYCVLTLVLPMYSWMADDTKILFRDAPYFLALLCSFVIFAREQDRSKKPVILRYLLILAVSILLILIVNIFCIQGANEKYSISQLITCSQAWMAFLIGRYIMTLIQQKYFSIVNAVIWATNCYFIISKVDLVSMQAIYGTEEDPTFSGSYQYIGDTFSFTSIVIISQLIGSMNNLQLMKKLNIFRSINNPRFTSKPKTLICLCSILFCDVLIFLNGSRSSFVCFTCIELLMFFRLRKIIFQPIVLGLILASIPIILTIAFSTFPVETIFENRNLEFMSNNGQSSSLDERTEFYESGLSDIFQHFFIGKYTQINIDGDGGSYIHNVLGVWQYFGIIPFSCFVLAMVESIKKYFTMFKSSINNYENIAYESMLLFSILSVLLFRNPIGFNVVFITFGVCSTISMPMHYRSHLPFKDWIFDRYSDPISPDRHTVASDLEFAIAYSHRQHKLATALVDYDFHAVSCEPKFALAYSERGNIRRRQGDFATALVDYDRAISLDPNLVIAYYNRGICHRQIGNHQAAIDDYTHTIALDPQYFDAYYQRGKVSAQLGDRSGAIADYHQAANLYLDRGDSSTYQQILQVLHYLSS
jgi:Tfp pilus assembly protein PilF